MRSQFLSTLLGIIVIVAVVIGWTSLYIVPPTQYALPVRFGEPLPPKAEPGLYWKAPFIDAVIPIDKRTLNLDTTAIEAIAGDQKRLVVDAFTRYRITNPLVYYQALRENAAAQERLRAIVNSAALNVLGRYAFQDIVRTRRNELMNLIRTEANQQSQPLGIEIVDFRFRRTDLPDANRAAVFQRMQSDRQKEAAQYRAEGVERKRQIEAEANRRVAQIKGEANQAGETIRGDADAQKTAIFAQAYSRDKEFFQFYLTLQKNQDVLKSGDTSYILNPDDPFFRYVFGRTSAGGATSSGTTSSVSPPAR